MKIIRITIMVLALLVLVSGEVGVHKRVYITVACVVVLMLGMMNLSAKTPSKNQNKEEDDI